MTTLHQEQNNKNSNKPLGEVSNFNNLQTTLINENKIHNETRSGIFKS
jgi:hypothetical protein